MKLYFSGSILQFIGKSNRKIRQKHFMGVLWSHNGLVSMIHFRRMKEEKKNQFHTFHFPYLFINSNSYRNHLKICYAKYNEKQNRNLYFFAVCMHSTERERERE